MSMSFFRWLLLSMATFLWIGCSSDGQEAVEEPAEEKSQEEAAAPDEAAGEEAANDAVNEAAPTADDEAAAAKPETPAPAPAAAPEPKGFNKTPSTRYVNSFALNVRSGPSKDAPVLRHVKWGDKVSAVINGEWAKLGPGEYISSKFLTTTPPGSEKSGGKKGKAKKGK